MLSKISYSRKYESKLLKEVKSTVKKLKREKKKMKSKKEKCNCSNITINEINQNIKINETIQTDLLVIKNSLKDKT